MNTKQYLLEEEWIVAVQDAIDSQPEHISEVIEPELMGRYDAEMGTPCDPLKYYIRLGDVEAYIIGHKEASAILSELEDLRDGRDEMDFVRGGC
jgi:hypothetical protein